MLTRLLGFIIKVKKILESICISCGKLKADIVSGTFPVRLLRTPPPNFLGALSTVHGEPQTHVVSSPRSLEQASSYP
jgi:DNA-directed RNA polymerase II subunit RPB1